MKNPHPLIHIARQLALGAALILAMSCGNKKSSNTANQHSENVAGGGELKYIKIEDSDTILPSWSKENIVIEHTIGDPDNLHPTNGTLALRSEIFQYTQLSLVDVDFHHLTLKPGAAKAMPKVSADGLQYTYEINSSIRWDDGAPLTPEDVVFTLKAVKCPLVNNPNVKPFLENLKDVVVSGPSEVTLHMRRPYIHDVAFLTDVYLMQRTFFDPENVLARYTLAQFDDPNFKSDQQKDLNEWAQEINNHKYGREPKYLVGLGAYQVEKWDAGQSVMLKRKENHWTKNSTDPYQAAYPEKIIFKLNKDANSQVLEFKSQTMDVSGYLSTKTLLQLQSDENFNKNYNSRFTDTYNYSYIAMNMKPDGVKHKKFFTDKKVRKAMALLTPADDINKIVNKGKNRRMVSPVSFLKPDFNEKLKPVPFDIEQAKKLLDEAGWKDTDGDNLRDKVIDGEKVQFSFDISYLNTQVEWKDMVQMTVEAFYKAGIKANPVPAEVAIFYENGQNHNFDMMVGAWANNSYPDEFTQVWHTSSWTSKGSNYTGFGTAETDALIDSIKYAIDDAKRIPLVKRFQEIVYEEQPYIFLFANLRRNVIHKRFGNCEMFFERPGFMINNLRLLSDKSLSSKPMASH